MGFRLIAATALALTMAGCVAVPPPGGPGPWPGPPPGNGPGPGPGPSPGPWPGPGPGGPGGPGPGPGGPGGPGVCRDGPARFAIGERYSSDLADEAAYRSGAEIVRIVRPGEVVTMEFNARRLTLELNRRDRVTDARCG